jgi:hypothetical protein
MHEKIITKLRKTGWVGLDLIPLSRNKDLRRALMVTVINFRVTKIAAKFLD